MAMVGGGHQSGHWGVVVDTCIRGLRRGCPMKDVKNDNKDIFVHAYNKVTPVTGWGV